MTHSLSRGDIIEGLRDVIREFHWGGENGGNYRWMHIEELDLTGSEPLFTSGQGQN
jgi:hypothetical protein